MYPGFMHWKARRCAEYRAAAGGYGSEGGGRRERWAYAMAGEEDAPFGFGGGHFGVRRPLRFLAYRLDLDDAQVKPYFELDNVLQNGVFYAANQLYGLTFKERHDIPVYQPDVRVVSTTRAPHLLLKADGTTPTEIVRSVRPPSGVNPDDALESLSLMTQNSTVRRFLGMSAIRTRPDFAFTEDDIVGVDWASAISSTPSNAEGITVPTLVMSMTCHYLVVPGEIVFNHLAARDKQFVLVEGATHNFTGCRPEYGDTLARTFDYVDGWLTHPGRFLRGAASVDHEH